MTPCTLGRLQSYLFRYFSIARIKMEVPPFSSNMIRKHDLTSNCWRIPDFYICIQGSIVCSTEHQRIINLSTIFNDKSCLLIMFKDEDSNFHFDTSNTKISSTIENDQVRESSWNWSFTCLIERISNLEIIMSIMTTPNFA